MPQCCSKRLAIRLAFLVRAGVAVPVAVPSCRSRRLDERAIHVASGEAEYGCEMRTHVRSLQNVDVASPRVVDGGRRRTRRGGACGLAAAPGPAGDLPESGLSGGCLGGFERVGTGAGRGDRAIAVGW
jgi:hypothetical protein